MSVSHRYQNFNTAAPDGNATPARTEEQLEDVKLSSFESGYQAGWDDAVKAQGDSDQKLTADFIQNLEDMSFTYHEAYAKLSEGMKPLMSKLITNLLPEVAQQSLGIQILDQINHLMDSDDSATIEIAVAPEKLGIIQELLNQKVSVPFAVSAEPGLTGGQVYLRAGQAEREIDLDAVLDGVNAAIAAYFHTTEQETDHG